MCFDIGHPFPVKKIAFSKDKLTHEGQGRRSAALIEHKRGRYVRAQIPRQKTTDLAIDATLRAAAPYQLMRGRRVGEQIIISSTDFREKVREKKIGHTILFVVDASGSMGANQRMVAAKGAILSLLIDAYQRRERVGMIAFKGKKAELILPPTNSVELAKQRLEILPTGGKTPLAHALWLAKETMIKEWRKYPRMRPLLVIISDGRANVSIGQQNPWDEVKQVAETLQKAGIESIVVDVEAGFVNLGRMQNLAEYLKAKYYRLEDLQADNLARLVRNYV
ncbi:MAG: VWA domain-containing protein [Candidatus Desulfofervidaceae bacterium]|nr:VWA domain-containing protein [Candidatus Desulfofervidaceae bacterium]MDL1970323.1 VWA domain-containing protein [Candidatus Desulfofervidaceae bacterium]